MGQGLNEAISEGYDTHALQRSPHMILLDNAFYDRLLRPAVARWALIWLHDHFTGKVETSQDVLLRYLEGKVGR